MTLFNRSTESTRKTPQTERLTEYEAPLVRQYEQVVYESVVDARPSVVRILQSAATAANTQMPSQTSPGVQRPAENANVTAISGHPRYEHAGKTAAEENNPDLLELARQAINGIHNPSQSEVAHDQEAA